MAQEKTKILWNRQVAKGYMHLGLESDKIAAFAKPGQFVMLKADKRKDPLLRRPFSIHRLLQKNGTAIGIELLYKVVGTVTKRLSQIPDGDYVDIVGPLGKGFTITENIKKHLLVAGGIGVAPLVFLADDLIQKGIDPKLCSILIGGKKNDDLLCQSVFEDLKINVTTITEEGSNGRRGLVTDLLPSLVAGEPSSMIYSCGPHPMLRAVAAITHTQNIPCQLSVETLMACGMGACLGCAFGSADAANGYHHACISGPVFYAKELLS